MQYKTLGRTGLRVSVLGYGGAPLGLAYYLADEDPADPAVQGRYLEALERAVELGVNYFDTAPGYGDGASEALLGRVLPKHRDQVILATKCPYDGPAAAVTASVDASLRRLGVDRVDVVQFHGGCYSSADADHILSGGMLDALERLRDAGKVRFLGITAEVPSGALERLLETGRFDVLQICYNVANQLACDHSRQCRGIVAVAERHEMGIVSMRTTTSGFLQRLLAQELGDAADAERVTRLCINYVLSTPEIDVALVGMRSCREVELNAALADDLAGRYDLADLHDRYRDLKGKA